MSVNMPFFHWGNTGNVLHKKSIFFIKYVDRKLCEKISQKKIMFKISAYYMKVLMNVVRDLLAFCKIFQCSLF